MTDKRCTQCMFSDICNCNGVCEFFYPVTEDAEDEVLDEIIEAYCKRFQDEWTEYLTNFYEES